jgi:RHS repeat-associated protein
VDYYKADVLTASDYYPFGMQMPGRHWTADSGDQYRFGFNGKEKDNKLYREGNVYNYKARQYNSRTGRFIRVDPLADSFPYLTPYNFASLTPIQAIDLNGEQKKQVTHYIDVHNDGEAYIKKTEVNIDQDWKYTTENGKEYAKTEVYYKLADHPDGSKFQDEESNFYEPTKKQSGGLVPSAAYDYTKEPIEGKASDDLSYVLEGEGGWPVSRYGETIERDLRAPDNRITQRDIQEFIDIISNVK